MVALDDSSCPITPLPTFLVYKTYDVGSKLLPSPQKLALDVWSVDHPFPFPEPAENTPRRSPHKPTPTFPFFLLSNHQYTV